MGGPPAAAAATAGTAAGAARQARLPRRLLAASAVVVALAVSLLVLAAAGTGHTELRLSAGVQLSIGRAAHVSAHQAAAAGLQEAHEQQQRKQEQQQAQPPLPEGDAPPAVGGSQEDEQEAYGSAYEGADLLSLLGGRQGAGKRQGSPAGSGGRAGARPASGRPAKTVQPKPVVTSEAAAARDSSAACSEVGVRYPGSGRRTGSARPPWPPALPFCFCRRSVGAHGAQFLKAGCWHPLMQVQQAGRRRQRPAPSLPQLRTSAWHTPLSCRPCT